MTNTIIIILLLLLSGLFSGLTIGLFSLNKNELQRKAELGDKKSKKILSIRKNGNLLLCTLLTSNVAVNSVLAILLGDLTGNLVAGITATILILIFGEIIPQAIFSRHALNISIKLTWLVKIFIFFLWPLCGPLAKLLDKILGEEIPTIYSKKELIKIIEEHQDSKESEIDQDEERIIKGALSFSNKTAQQIMTPRKDIYALEADTIISSNLLEKIKKEGFSRIPIFKKSLDNIIGIIYVKDLINIKENVKAEKICQEDKALRITSDQKLDTLLNLLIQSEIHLAFIKNKKRKLEGLITLEDVIEEIIKQEIVDEKNK